MAFDNTRGRRTCSQMSTPRIGVCAGGKSGKPKTTVRQLPMRRTNQRILVCSGNNLKLLGTFVVSLTSQNWELIHLNFEGNGKKRTSQPHPLPWIAAVVALNFFLKSSTEPKSRSIAVFSGPSASLPPSVLAGARFFQKRE